MSVGTIAPSTSTGRGTQAGPMSDETGRVAWTEWADRIEQSTKAAQTPVRLWIDGEERSYARGVNARADLLGLAEVHSTARNRMLVQRIRLGAALNSLVRQVGPYGAGYILGIEGFDRRTLQAAMQLARELGNPDGSPNWETIKGKLDEQSMRLDVRVQLEPVGRPKVLASGEVDITLKEAMRLVQRPKRNPPQNETGFVLADPSAVAELPGGVVWTEEDGACEVGAEEPFDWVGQPDSDVPDDVAEGEEDEVEAGGTPAPQAGVGEGTPAVTGQMPVPPVPSPQSPVPAPARRYSAPVVQMSLAEVYERAAIARATVERLARIAETSPAMAARVAEAFAALEAAAMEIGGGE